MLRRSPFFALIFQQAVTFVIGWGSLVAVRKLTGKNIHGGVDPIGVVDGILGFVSILLSIWFTLWFYRLVRPHAKGLLDVPSFLDVRTFVLGFFVTFIVQLAPSLVGLCQGSITVADKITNHVSGSGSLRLFCVGLFFFMLNSIQEETNSRASPLRILSSKSVISSLAISALCFSGLHLMSEGFSWYAFCLRFMIGLVLGLAYLRTGTIWFSAGLHTGINCALVWTSGLWNLGALVLFDGVGSLFFQFPLWIWTVVAVSGIVSLALKRFPISASICGDTG